MGQIDPQVKHLLSFLKLIFWLGVAGGKFNDPWLKHKLSL